MQDDKLSKRLMALLSLSLCLKESGYRSSEEQGKQGSKYLHGKEQEGYIEYSTGGTPQYYRGPGEREGWDEVEQFSGGPGEGWDGKGETGAGGVQTSQLPHVYL